MKTRNAVVRLAQSWIGLKESDWSFKKIIDIYNSLPKEQRPRKVTMITGWPWCACTWSALAIQLGYMDIMPIEISCGKLIERAKDMGCWQENDGFIPAPGDGVLYDWDDSGVGDNTGWPDHIGIVEAVYKDAGYFVVIEGNYDKAVKKRTISINGKFIRGFIVPKYDEEDQPLALPNPDDRVKTVDELAREIIAGKWGRGHAVRSAGLAAAGYDNYEEIRARVNEILNGSAVTAKNPEVPQDQNQPAEKKVAATCYARFKDPKLAGSYKTTANLHCRNDAGTNKKSLCLIPKGTVVKNYGFYTEFNGLKWLSIQFVMDGVQYTGFSASSYLEKV